MYPLVVDDAVYASLIQNAYDAARWMRETRVREEAIRIGRSKKKLQELCKKGAIQIEDSLTMRKEGRDGSVVAFSATIKAFDAAYIPIMKTTGDLTKTRWPMLGPNDFDRQMVRNHSSLRVSSRGTWDTVSVRRNGQDLGSLYLIRQCLQLREMEIEKWGCNGLGEELGDSIMPSLNRPNAPDRLPSSDFGNLFGRPRAIRGSDLGSSNSSSSHPSPLTTPSNIAAQRRALRFSEGSNVIPATTSPLASPSPFGAARPRPKGVERRSYHSDASAASPPESSNVASPSSELPFILGDESAPQTGRIDSEISSSVTLQARLLHDLPGIQITPSAGSEQPPRTPRSGFKWKREFSGRWFEIRIGRQAQSAEHSVQESGEITPLPPSHSSTIRLPLSNASTSSDLGAHDQSPNAQSDQPLLPESRDSSDYTLLTPKEGLYCRTKRALGLKHDPLDPTNPTNLSSRERTETDNLLERVSSTLRFLPDRKTPSQSSATSVSNLSIAAPRWQRIMSRHGRLGSTSSSIRGMMMGKPPLHTPEPEAMYTGSDSNTYVAVNLTEEGVAFLPSEARRVHTPPLPTGSTTSGKIRGFFFDYNAPLTPTSVFPERTTAAPAATAVVDATNAHARMGVGPRRDSDWYRVKTDTIEAEGDSREQLAAAVPEHLPNSPLCPRHPKHKSGGMGECPYHGRNPSLPKDVDDGASPERSPPSEIWW